MFAGLLLPAGAVGDRDGRKGALLVGLGIFGSAAIAASFSDTPLDDAFVERVVAATVTELTG